MDHVDGAGNAGNPLGKEGTTPELELAGVLGRLEGIEGRVEGSVGLKLSRSEPCEL